MLLNAEEDQIILVVAEPKSLLSKLTVEYLKSCSLTVELLILDKDFFLDYQEKVKKLNQVYKIIFIYGFHSVSKEVYGQIFDFFHLINKKQDEEIPSILISSVTTSLEILNDFNFAYQEYLSNEEAFLSDYLSEFKNSLLFLAQDIISKEEKINYPLLLFFSAIKQGYIFDLQAKFYFQDEKTFFELIKTYLIRPHKNAKFIVKGSSINSEVIVKKIVYLYEQYFQKKNSIVKLFADERISLFFQEFSLVNNSKSNYEDLIDEKIRRIYEFGENLNSIAPSQIELEKAIEMSKLQKNNKKNKEKTVSNVILGNEVSEAMILINQAYKEPSDSLKTKVFDGEFVKKIETLFSTQRKKEKHVRQQKNIVQGKEIIQKSKKRKILFWLGSFGFGLGFILLLLFSLFSLSQEKISDQLYIAVKNNGENIEKIDKSIFYRFFSFQLKQYLKVFPEENLTDAIDIRELENSLVSTNRKDQEFQKKAFDLYKNSINGGVELGVFYDDLLTVLNEKIETDKVFNSYLMSLNMDLYQGEEKSTWQKTLLESKNSLKNSLQFKRFITSFKNFIFQPGRINLLVLIQDSSEIRATGGFLTEAVILSFDNGVLVDKQVLDVNDVDARVYGHREADQEIKDLLGEKNFYFRDSNWQVDFANSSREAESFVEQITGYKIDLSIALNSKTFSSILKSLKELTLTSGTKITALNYLDSKEKTASLDYKSMNDEKFSWQLTNALVEKITNLEEDQFISLFNVLAQDLNQKEILLKSNSQELQQAIESNSWSGRKLNISCPSEFKQEKCLIDSIYQVESNVGINKINPYIKESIEHNLGIGKDFIRHKHKILFENLARNNSWPLGSYKNYLRFYLNPQANLEKIEINGQALDLTKIKITDSAESKEIGVFIEIPEQNKLELTITYLVPNSSVAPFSYVFFDQKQPGILVKQTKYNIVFDEQFKPQLIAPQAVYQDKIIYFENDNSDHFLFAISFI